MVRIVKLQFNSKNKFKWKFLEKKLISFIGEEVVIQSNNKTVIFDNNSADEMSSSKYNFRLHGKMKLVKANACLYYKDLLKTCTNERHQEDFNKNMGNLLLMVLIDMMHFLNIQIKTKMGKL